jgi:gamma-glutamyltranspeptidase/glutathione hydrolase
VATSAAAASEGHVAQAARTVLARGNAVDAVVAGVLAAAAAAPGVLLGPVQVLVAGAGAGLLAVDGRVRQPGLGAPRPRGTVTGDAVPQAARVGVPAMPAALAAALAAAGSVTMRRVCLEAVEAARGVSGERAAVLASLAKRGAPAMADEAIAGELAALAGRIAGGVLTQRDLSSVRPALAYPKERSLDPEGWLRAPWREGASDASRTHVVVAADHRGLLCAACYESAEEGVAIPALGLLAPALAAPVMRGQTRVRPGEPRPSAAPIAIRVRAGLADLAVGVGTLADAETALQRLLPRLDETPLVADAVSTSAGRGVAVARTRESAVVAASA